MFCRFAFSRSARFGHHAGREIADGHQLLPGAQQAHRHPMQVEPVVAPPALGPEAVVEIEAVDVSRYALEYHLPFGELDNRLSTNQAPIYVDCFEYIDGCIQVL